ncbi:BN159_2729 family protein [Streptomyces sp. NPDC002159]
MTTAPEPRTEAEQDLADRLRQLAAAFMADLETQGRLVENGGAHDLEQLRAAVDARRNLPAHFRAAVDAIVDDFGFTRERAVSIATALRRRGLLGDDGEPEPQHGRAPDSGSPSPGVRGAVVLARHFGPPLSTAQSAVRDPGSPGDWDEARGRAVVVATDLQTTHGDRLELMQIAPDHDRVTVAIRALSLADWEYWLQAIGAPVDVITRRIGYAETATGQINGVDVQLTAHEVPRLLDAMSVVAGEPYYLSGRVYDLSCGQIDRAGRVWLYLGQRQEGEQPLLTMRGGDGTLYSLETIVSHLGPLTPAAPEVLPAVPEAGGAS